MCRSKCSTGLLDHSMRPRCSVRRLGRAMRREWTVTNRAVVIGDHAQRQMVIPKKEHETRKERNKRRIRNRMVYNDWGLYGFVQMLTYKCLRFGKALSIISERDTTKTCHACKHKQDMPLWVRTY